MAGRLESLDPMWERLGKKLALEPKTELIGNVYLGCGQESYTPTTEQLHLQKLRYQYITSSSTADDETILSDLKLAHIGDRDKKPKGERIPDQHSRNIKHSPASPREQGVRSELGL